MPGLPGIPALPTSFDLTKAERIMDFIDQLKALSPDSICNEKYSG